MQPISTMRSPPAGDRPVVSVSKTISRMSLLKHPSGGRDKSRISRTWARVSFRVPEVSTTKSARSRFSSSGSWRARICSNFSAVMPGRASTRSRCNRGRRGDDDDLVERLVAAGFEQQGDVEQQRRRIGMLDDEAGPLMVNRGMDDRFQRGEFVTVAEHRRRQGLAVDGSIARAAGKARLDQRHQSPARPLQPAHDGVGIEDRNAGVGEHRGDGRLAHADRPGERERDHGRSNCQSSASRSRGGFCAEKQLEAGRGLLDQHVEAGHHLAARAPAPPRSTAFRPGRRPCRTPSHAPACRCRSQLRQSRPGHAERRGVDQPIAVDRRGEWRRLGLKAEFDRQLASPRPCRAPGS